MRKLQPNLTQTETMKIVICGLSITSSWGNGHATTYRALTRELVANGHDVLFLECDRPWYSAHRDLPEPPYGRTELYQSFDELQARFAREILEADAVIVGSFVQDGIAVGNWVTREARGLPVFYDIDTPETLAAVQNASCTYLNRELIPRYALYLSFTGGPTLGRLENEFLSPMSRALYCSVDPQQYYPADCVSQYDLGYLGTYSSDRQPTLEQLLLNPARQWPGGRFIVAGAQFPTDIDWGPNVMHMEHLPPNEHRLFYNSLRFTLNVTRTNMIRAGYSPSVRLFEAAACGTPIISDYWEGITELFEPDEEILIASTPEMVNRALRELPENRRLELGNRAKARILRSHTAAHRTQELLQYLREALERKSATTIARTRDWKQNQTDRYVNQ